jgi:hypothetical protein
MTGIGTPSSHKSTPLPKPMVVSCLDRENAARLKLFRDVREEKGDVVKFNGSAPPYVARPLYFRPSRAHDYVTDLNPRLFTTP